MKTLEPTKEKKWRQSLKEWLITFFILLLCVLGGSIQNADAADANEESPLSILESSKIPLRKIGETEEDHMLMIELLTEKQPALENPLCFKESILDSSFHQANLALASSIRTLDISLSDSRESIKVRVDYSKGISTSLTCALKKPSLK